MDRTRLALVALALSLLAACKTTAPTTPEAERTAPASAAFDEDSTERGGTAVGSGN